MSPEFDRTLTEEKFNEEQRYIYKSFDLLCNCYLIVFSIILTVTVTCEDNTQSLSSDNALAAS